MSAVKKKLIQDKDFFAALMLVITIRQAMNAYKDKYDRKHTYETLVKASGILEKLAERLPESRKRFPKVARSTIESMASKKTYYNTTLGPINTLSYLLDTTTLVQYTSERTNVHSELEVIEKPVITDDRSKTKTGTARIKKSSLDLFCSEIVKIIEEKNYEVDIDVDGDVYCAIASHQDRNITRTAKGKDIFRVLCDLAELAKVNFGIKAKKGKKTTQSKTKKKSKKLPKKKKGKPKKK